MVAVGYFEDYYTKKQAENTRGSDALAVEAYNENIRIINEVRAAILAKVRVSPPDEWSWVIINGERRVSWNVWVDYDCYDKINLMPDGTFVHVREDYSHTPENAKVLRTFKALNPISSIQELEIGEADMIRDLRKSIGQTLKFGISAETHWL